MGLKGLRRGIALFVGSSALILFSQTATAKGGGGFMLEPYLNYAASGSYEYTAKPLLSQPIDASVTGPAFGLKIGGNIGGFLLGAEYTIYRLTGEYDSCGSNCDAKLNFDGMGAFIGYAFTPALRFIATYYVQLTNKEDNSEAKGTGMKAGIHYMVMSFLNLGLDYQTYNFDELEPAGGITEFDVTGNAIMLTIGFPIM
ncbi:MAG: hypothetical protein H6624_01420 [Bdellovibrionaceae bacterium]|nr:hypothetical protein [Pseudobdellovibrionaceae bacterium]